MSGRGDGAPFQGDQPDGGEVEIVRRSDDEAVLFKPAGLSSERAGDPGLDSLLARARILLGWTDARLPHRLDRPTRGLMVVSRDAVAAARHGDEIRAHAWTKWYLARIPATGRSADGTRLDATALAGPHRAYLRRDGDRARIVRSGGDPSRLTILAVAPATDRRDEAHALIHLETGRFHQIRAMLAHAGFPLAGDTTYGGAPRSGHPSTRDGTVDIDLESVALRIERAGRRMVHRLETHPARRGVASELERALDAAISAPTEA